MVSIVLNTRKSLKHFRVSCKKQKHHYNRSQSSIIGIYQQHVVLSHKVHFFMLNNVPPCNFQGLIVDVILMLSSDMKLFQGRFTIYISLCMHNVVYSL